MTKAQRVLVTQMKAKSIAIIRRFVTSATFQAVSKNNWGPPQPPDPVLSRCTVSRCECVFHHLFLILTGMFGQSHLIFKVNSRFLDVEIE